MRVARAPQQRAARLAERVEGTDEREIPQRLLFETGAAGELVERAIRTVRALGNDRRGFSVAKRLHGREPEPDVVNAARAMASDRFGKVDRTRTGGLLTHGLRK